MNSPQMNDQSCPLAHSDAAYVLGSLSATDRLEFERHLPGCESCRRSVADFAGLPGLLARVPVEQVEAPTPVEPLPTTVLPALVAVVRREQRRKALLITLGAAAAIAVVALGAAAVQSSRDDASPVASPVTTSPSITPAQPMTVVHDYGMRADLSLTPVGWGTKVNLTCSYPDAEGEYGEGHAYEYRLVAYTGDGKREKVMSWLAVPGKTMSLPGSTSAVLDDITRVEVQSDHGRTILRLDL